MAKQRAVATSGPLAAYVPGFKEELVRLGYSTTPAKQHLQLVGHLSRWLEDEDLTISALATQDIERFFQARRQAGYSRLLTARSLIPLARYLHRIDMLAEPEPVPVTGPLEMLLADFASYLLVERGLTPGTIRFYVHVAGLFASERLGSRGGLELADLTACDVTGFVTRCCAPRSLSSSRQVVSALRSLLRFLRLEGHTDLALDQAVLSVSGSASSLPRGIGAPQALALLAGCDANTLIGLRDRAILALLVRLGLRDGEVVALELADINWRAGEIAVSGKGRRLDRLPLPTDVGAALADYLQVRPTCDSTKVFLRCFAPIRGLDAGTGVIRGVLARACERAGVPYACPHRLRHTVATDMLAAGAPLSEIGQVLRHRSAATTAIYAKVDFEALRNLARPWPGSAR